MVTPTPEVPQSPEDAAPVPPLGAAATVASPVPSGGDPAAPSMGWVAWAALGVGTVALVASGLVWQRLGKTQEEMARRSADTLTEAAAARTLAAQADAEAKDLQARLGVAEIRLSEVTLQRSQLEELMLSVSRSRDDSLVQDIESAVRLAVQQSQLTGSTQPLISTLQGAEQRIEKAAQPRLNPVQRAISRDIERIRSANLLDVPTLTASLDGVVRQLDVLPLRNGLPSPAAPLPAPADATDPGASPPETMVPSDVTEPPFWQRWWGQVNAWTGDAANRWWAQFRQGTADLVRVSRIDQPEAALLAPEQSYFLRENLKLRVLNARLGVLARQFDTARADLREARELVYRYFDPEAPGTRAVLATLDQLQFDLRQEALPRPEETLAALTVAAGGR